MNNEFKKWMAAVVVIGVIIQLIFAWRQDRREEHRNKCTCRNK
jgi:hypothetical protein